jgi:hypothetical protein
MSIINYLTNWKYRYFVNKLRGVKKMILDLEFKRFKTREIREEVRQEYDNTKSRLAVLENQVGSEKEKPSLAKDEFKRLEDQQVVMTRDAERYQAQMKHLDVEIEGSPETNEYPDGIQGINSQLESLHELEGMVKDYLKHV